MSQENSSKKDFGILGIHDHQVSCIIGVYPEERLKLQNLFFDAKIKVDLSRCFASGCVKETVDYVQIAAICTAFAQKNKYFLLESLASDILDECFHRFPIAWAWILIKKPAAIPTAAYAFVELERYRENGDVLCGH